MCTSPKKKPSILVPESASPIPITQIRRIIILLYEPPMPPFYRFTIWALASLSLLTFFVPIGSALSKSRVRKETQSLCVEPPGTRLTRRDFLLLSAESRVIIPMRLEEGLDLRPDTSTYHPI